MEKVMYVHRVTFTDSTTGSADKKIHVLAETLLSAIEEANKAATIRNWGDERGLEISHVERLMPIFNR